MFGIVAALAVYLVVSWTDCAGARVVGQGSDGDVAAIRIFNRRNVERLADNVAVSINTIVEDADQKIPKLDRTTIKVGKFSFKGMRPLFDDLAFAGRENDPAVMPFGFPVSLQDCFVHCAVHKEAGANVKTSCSVDPYCWAPTIILNDNVKSVDRYTAIFNPAVYFNFRGHYGEVQPRTHILPLNFVRVGGGGDTRLRCKIRGYGFMECLPDQDDADASEKDGRAGQDHHPKAPLGRLALGLQILLAAVGFGFGIAYFVRALDVSRVDKAATLDHDALLGTALILGCGLWGVSLIVY